MSAQDIRELDPYAVELGVKIHTQMFRQRMSQQQLAVRLGLTQAGISRKLRGLTSVTVPELIQIGRILGVDPADLLPREADLVLLPRLDSNQQPSGYQHLQVSALPEHCPVCGYRHREWCHEDAATVVDLFTRERVA